MREIKFRAWDTDEKYMYEVESLAKLALYPQYRYILLQYTGLKDKNGKEIYEGDVVTFMYNSSPQTPRTGAVRWDDYYAGFMFAEMLLEPTPRETIEVIGNIYTNPELITK